MEKGVISALPYNLEAEQCVLGSILIDKELQFDIRAKLNKEDFYIESHKLVFDSICAVLDSNKPVDIVILSDEMNKTPVKKDNRKKVDLATLVKEMEKNTTLTKAGGIEYLSELSRATPSASNYEFYLNIVKRDSLLRKLIRSADDIINDCKVSVDSKSSLSKAESLILSISDSLESSSLTNLKYNVDEVIDLFKNIQTDKNFMQGLKTGFTVYDSMTNGLHKGNLVIIAARPSVGKTTFVMNIVEHVAIAHNAVCAVFALEMTKSELAERMMYSISNVSSQKARKGTLDKNEWKKLWDAQKIINRTNIFIDDTSMTTVPDILSKCRKLKSTQGRLDLIVVDHIQLMNAVKSSESRQAEITEISRGLKMIAKELDVPVIVLSQLNRSVEKGGGRKPVLSDLRESGAIEQDADLVMFIHRPEMVGEVSNVENVEAVKRDETELIISKNRSGPRGSFTLLFKGENYKFVNIAQNTPNEPNFDYNNNENTVKKIEIDQKDIPPENFTEVEEGGLDDVF